MIEVIGIISMCLSVTGVVLNNRKLKICFIFWVISNTFSGYIHYNSEVYSLLLRDFVFILLAIEGWFKWGNSEKTN